MTITTLSLWLFLAVAVSGQWANQTIHQPRCFPSEKEALLEFKKHLKDPSNRLATWDAAAAPADDDDCCSWYGVSCHHQLGGSTIQHVTGLHLRSLSPLEYYDEWDEYVFGGNISSALLSLKHLRYLDLSWNDFEGINIPSFLGSLRSLRYLNLSKTGFGGMIPHQLANLSNLQYLNLHRTSYYPLAYVENLQWVSGLSSLKFLDLSGWNLSKVLNWDNVILTKLPSLLELHLSWCQLPSPQPHSLHNNINASSISILDLSYNYIGRNSATFLGWISSLKTLNSLNIEDNEFHGSIPKELKNLSSLQEVYFGLNFFNSSIPNWSSLSILDLSVNQFHGPIPDEIQNMTSLQKLDLSSNKFSSSIPEWLNGLTRLEDLNLEQLGSKLKLEGVIPKSFKDNCNLRVLNLGGVKLRQDINQVLEILSLPGCVSNGLEELYLNDCQLFGNLTTINQHFDRLMSLKILNLGFNNFTGTFPVKFGKLEKLEELLLEDNKLVGNVSEVHFENLKELRCFYASGNRLKLRVSSNWIPPFDQLTDLDLESWHIGPQFPTWLRSLKNLQSLDLSNSGISSTIPVWFWNLSSNHLFLNLSHNQLHGVLPHTLPQLLDTRIDMSSNRFYGPLPLISSDLGTLDLSDNSFSDSISKFLCRPNISSTGMQLLDLNLGQNLLHGEIPNCLSDWPDLGVINLSNNKFSGTIPESIGTLRFLQSLHLRNNILSGELPRSLTECTELMTMDVGENRLVGNISSFISAQSLSRMKILILRSNKLSGPISEKLCHAASLQILDLADNLLHGTIPSCLVNLSAMTKMNESRGVIQVSTGSSEPTETALLRTKGNMLEYSTNLGFVRSLDFSNNKLYGKIPDEITGLSALLSLNLSHNAFSGGIPKSIGFVKELESMDLSANQLTGEIPQSISNLTFLGMLNLSQNRLSGRIPFGNQIQNFNTSSFDGNELCGSPLANKCSNDVVSNDANEEGGEKDDDDGDGMIWLYVSMSFGFVGGFWCFVGPLLLNRHWRFAYSELLDRMWDKIWWKLHRFGMF